MAFKGKVADSKTVLLHLVLCLVIFYTVYYMIASVCFGAFKLDNFDGLIPFDFKIEPPESNSKYLVNLLSMELTYFSSGLLFAAVVKRWVWDYALTVTLFHVLLTSNCLNPSGHGLNKVSKAINRDTGPNLLLCWCLSFYAIACLYEWFSAIWRRGMSLLTALSILAHLSQVMLEFPLVWQWWLALGSGLFLMICNGQLIAYFACQSDPKYPVFHSY